MSIFKLAKKITIDTKHIVKDDKELARIKSIVMEMLRDDKKAVKK